MVDEIWAEIRKDPEPAPEEVLALAEEERQKNQEFNQNLGKAMAEMRRHHSPTLRELCDAGEEDYARDLQNEVQGMERHNDE